MPMESLAEISRNFLRTPSRNSINRQALYFPHGVVHDNEALVPSRGVGRAGGVCQVMIDGMNALLRKMGEMPVELLD